MQRAVTHLRSVALVLFFLVGWDLVAVVVEAGWEEGERSTRYCLTHTYPNHAYGAAGRRLLVARFRFFPWKVQLRYLFALSGLVVLLQQ